MKIFILLSRVPYPLEKGDKVRAYNQIKSLSKNNEITLYAIHDSAIIEPAREKLSLYCKNLKFVRQKKNNIFFSMLKAVFSGLPLQVGYFYNDEIKKEIHEAIRKYKPDVIYCQLCRTAEYVKDIKDIPKVLDFMDAFSKGAERRSVQSSFIIKWLFKLESKRMREYEKKMFDIFNETTIISEQDREFIYNPEGKEISVISNGVDFDFFKPVITETKYDCVFTGNMNYPPNIDGAIYLAEKIFPLVLKQKPDAKLLIAGANPSSAIKKLKSENIHISGWMEDIRPAYSSSRIFVAPLRMGTGVQNKVLEAMAMGIPCISSKLVAKPLHIDESGLLTAENEDDFAKKIISLLENPGKAKMITEKAYQFIYETHNWDKINLKLENIFSKLTLK